MEKIGIIIGFDHSYDYGTAGQVNKNSLPGIIVDMYSAYNACIRAKMDKILVITDIHKDIPTRAVIESLKKGEVDLKIQTFITRIRSLGQYWQYSSQEELIETISNFVGSTLNSNNQKIFCYYSGHIQNECIILPGKRDSHISLIKMRQLLISNFDSKFNSNDQKTQNNQIFMFVDGCYTTNVGLPFHLVEVPPRTNFDSPTGGYTRIPKTRLFLPQIVVLTSSRETQLSITTCEGSPLSNAFFSYLKLLSNKLLLLEQGLAQFRQEIIKNGETNIEDPQLRKWEREQRINWTQNQIYEIGYHFSFIALIKHMEYQLQYLQFKRAEFRGYTQNANVYSSFPHLTSMWHWLVTPSRASVGYDPTMKSAMVQV